MAAIAAVGDDAADRGADLLLHVGDDLRQRMAVVRIAGQRLHVRDELPAPRAKERRRHRHLDAELIGAMRLALADTFDLGRMQAVDLAAAALLALLAHAFGEIKRAAKNVAQRFAALDASCNVALDATQEGSDLAQRLARALELGTM